MNHPITTHENFDEELFYFDYVDWMIRERRNEWLSNAKPEHAVYIMRKFFENATEKIRVFTGRLKQYKGDISVWADPDVIEAARGFLNKSGTQLLIVSEDGEIDNEPHPFIQTLRDFAGQGKMQIRTADKVSIRFLKKHDICRHFVLMDNRGIRLETDPSKTQAHVNFNMNKSYSETYGWVFDEVLFDVAQPFFKR